MNFHTINIDQILFHYYLVRCQTLNNAFFGCQTQLSDNVTVETKPDCIA